MLHHGKEDEVSVMCEIFYKAEIPRNIDVI